MADNPKSALSQLKGDDKHVSSSKVQKQTNTQSSSVSIHKFSIIKSDLDVEVFEREYKRLKASLEVGTDKLSYSRLGEAIDKVTENARIAGNMYVAAREEYEKFEKIEYAIWWSDVSNKAMRELEKAKKRQEISGQIGDEKIRNNVISQNKDKYAEMNDKLIQLRTVKDVLEILYRQWESRKSLLQTQGNMLDKRITIEGKK